MAPEVKTPRSSRNVKIGTKQMRHCHERLVRVMRDSESCFTTLFKTTPITIDTSSDFDQNGSVVQRNTKFQKCGPVQQIVLRKLLELMEEDGFFNKPKEETKTKTTTTRDTFFLFSEDKNIIYNKKGKIVLQNINSTETLEFNLNNLTGLLVSYFSKCKNPSTVQLFYQLIPVVHGDMELSTTNIFKLAKHLKYEEDFFTSDFLEFFRLLWVIMPPVTDKLILGKFPYLMFQEVLEYIKFHYPNAEVKDEQLKRAFDQSQKLYAAFPDLAQTVKELIVQRFNLNPDDTVVEISKLLSDNASSVPELKKQLKRKRSSDGDNNDFIKQKKTKK